VNAPDDERPSWDDELAARIIGKTLLIGITYCHPDGSVREQKQLHGIAVEADPNRGVSIACQGENIGRRYTVPPDFRSLQPAEPGEYRLKSTGEIIKDPDYTSSWTITRPKS
jgi:hypothetical protein